MKAMVRAALLMLCISLYAGAQSRSLALYAGEANGLDASAIQAAQKELRRLVAPTGVDVVWKDLTSRKSGEQFDEIVVMTFSGSCSDLAASLVPGSLQSPQMILADSSVSDGHVLPFLRIDCGYLVQILAPTLRSLNTSQRNDVLGRALARVMAHEIYHIVGETTAHQAKGVAKASFSVRDLTGGEFDFDSWSLAQMRSPRPAVAQSFAAPVNDLVSDPAPLLER